MGGEGGCGICTRFLSSSSFLCFWKGVSFLPTLNDRPPTIVPSLYLQAAPGAESSATGEHTSPQGRGARQCWPLRSTLPCIVISLRHGLCWARTRLQRETCKGLIVTFTALQFGILGSAAYDDVVHIPMR